ncbi:hypothetical protein CFC21_066563 [Triticum aestivum]|uniref:NET domain-containing protein n=2 Tax=Triticum aestivum TaxID=4565 RepID=A0A3B6KL23_WHEAT|nr:hypothetical protein CFC21_066563 [Triticum aestivum]
MEIARREPFSIMSGSGRKRPRPLEILRKRFQSELVAVRRLLAEAATVLPASCPSAPRVRVRPAEEPLAKKRKASPPVPMKKMTPKERNQLYADLTKLAKLSESHVLPAHILELLKKHSRRGICDDYVEIEMHAVQDAALVEMQKQLDKFLRERAQDQEEDEDVDIVGGVSPLPVRPTPVQLVVEEDEEYVDICGDASPVKNLGQGATISGSSGLDSGSSHQSVDSRPAPAERAANSSTPPTRDLIARANKILERRRKEETSRAREKARQELLEMERTAMPKDTLDEDVKALGIDQYNTARPNNLLRQMGLFLKLDDHDLKQQQQQHHNQSCQEDLEEGEIRL